jgi:endogenous inhibitor of DNA gyrase (YacG/DUF329 family)
MIQGRCPTCAKTYEIEALGDLPTFPFCSERCRLIDLGRWIDESYVIPGPAQPPAAPPERTAEDDED